MNASYWKGLERGQSIGTSQDRRHHIVRWASGSVRVYPATER